MFILHPKTFSRENKAIRCKEWAELISGNIYMLLYKVEQLKEKEDIRTKQILNFPETLGTLMLLLFN